MKVLYVLKTNEGATWAYRHVEWILSHNDKYEFVIVLPKDYGGFADKYKTLGCKVVGYDMSLPIRTPWLFPKKKRKINEIVRNENPDIIHSHFVTTTFMLRLALRNDDRIRIFQVPGPLHLESPIFRLAEKLTIRKNDFLLGACEWTCKAYHEMGVPEDHIYLAYYGTPEEYEIDLNSSVLRDKHNISDSTPLVGMVSYFYAPKRYMLQFRGLKGHEDFIDAISMVRKKIPDAIGIIIGSAWGSAGKYEEHVHRYANKVCPEGIVFAGFRSDVPQIYHELNVVVHPSHSENLGGAAESLSLAIPTISTNVGGFPDLVIDGKTGWTVPRKNPKAIAEKIVWMLEHEEAAAELATEGKKLWKEKICIESTAPKIIDIYDSLLEKRKQHE